MKNYNLLIDFIISTKSFDTENIHYMDKYIENRLDDEYIYLDEYEDWYEENKDLKIEEDVE